MEIKYLKNDESAWTQAELEAMFGAMEIEGVPGQEFEVYALQGRYPDAEAAEVVHVLDEAGRPMAGVEVVFFWPDAPIDSSLGWYGRGVVGVTNHEGVIGFGMGEGAWYFPPRIGPHSVWIKGQGKSQLVDGIGMVGGSNHKHVNVWYRKVAPQPPAPTDFEQYVRAKLAQMDAKLDEIAEMLNPDADAPVLR